MAIDLHAHWVPPGMARSLRERSGQAPRIEPLATGGERLVMPVGTIAFHEGFVDPALRLDFMARAGVKKQLLSLPGLFGVDSLAFEVAEPLTRDFNDSLAALCRAHPAQFAGLASLPLANIDVAVAELRRARKDLNLLGAIVPADAFVSEASAARLAPIFAAGNALGAHIFVHPGPMPGVSPAPMPPGDHDLARRALRVQHDVGEAMVTLLLSDFLDPWPDVTVHVANLGGTFPAVVERMDHTVQLRDPLSPLPSSRARRVWVDCSSLGAGALEQAVRVFGADRVVLGTDCPIFDTERTLAAVREARLSGAERAAILVGNADGLLARLA